MARRRLSHLRAESSRRPRIFDSAVTGRHPERLAVSEPGFHGSQRLPAAPTGTATTEKGHRPWLSVPPRRIEMTAMPDLPPCRARAAGRARNVSNTRTQAGARAKVSTADAADTPGTKRPGSGSPAMLARRRRPTGNPAARPAALCSRRAGHQAIGSTLAHPPTATRERSKAAPNRLGPAAAQEVLTHASPLGLPRRLYPPAPNASAAVAIRKEITDATR